MPGIEAISGLGVDALAMYRQLPQYAALDAASAVGDARIQAQSTGRIQPESFTH